MNCKEFKNIIDLGHTIKEQQLLLDEHIAQCLKCRNYFMLVNFSIENADQLLESEDPQAGFAAKIGAFVFDQTQVATIIPMWLKITTAAAAIASGLFIGSAVYDSRTDTAENQQFTYINPASDTVLMAETTEIMYLSIMNANEGK